MSKLKEELDELKDQIKQIEKQIERIIDRKETKMERISKEVNTVISELENQISKAETKLRNLESARQKRCKHDGEIGRRFNPRDDASFEYWLFCRKCGLDVGYQHFDGQVHYNVPIVGKIVGGKK